MQAARRAGLEEMGQTQAKATGPIATALAARRYPESYSIL